MLSNRKERIAPAWQLKLKRFKDEIPTIYYAFQDDRVPLFSKALLLGALMYLLCPIDLLPDFIPFLGFLDDVIIVPALVVLALQATPEAVLEDCRAKSRSAPHARLIQWLSISFFCAIVLGLACLTLRYFRSAS